MTGASEAARVVLDDPGVARVLGVLDRDGEEARVVGGAVRNALLGRPVSDHDVTTTATPDVVTRRAEAAGLRVVPTGLDHGTVTVLVGGTPFEVTTLREDVETDGRHAVIRFGRDFERDALRRDFTINALSLSADGTIHDYAGGLADIAGRRVRFIGDPATRIREDFLRVLRFFRFSADYADGLDDEGLAAAIAERAGLARLSRERVRQELLKLLAARRAAPVVATMTEAGLLEPLLGRAPRPNCMARLIAIEPGAGAILRLAGLAASGPADAEGLREALRLSKAEAARIEGAAAAFVRLRGDGDTPQPRLLREVLFDGGRRAALDGLALAWAAGDASPGDAAWASARRFLADTPEPHLPFSAADLLARGMVPGRALGEALKRLQANWIRAGFPQDPRSLAALLAEVAEG